MRVTGLVLTLNGERLLERCLRSLAFCDEVLVVDSESTDRTVEIADSCGARVLVNPWPGPVEQFRFAFANIETDWVVSLDQDEVITDELRGSIEAALADPGEHAGFYTSRSTWYFDRFMKHSGWYPDWLLRVFNKDRMALSASGAHYHFRPEGPTRNLDGDILHYSYRNFFDHLDKINYYAQKGAEDLRAKGRRGGVTPAITHGLGRFFKLYALKKGFLDGRAGFINACAGAFYAFQKYVRIEEKGDWDG